MPELPLQLFAVANLPTIRPVSVNFNGSFSGQQMRVVNNPSSLTCEGTRTYTYEYSDDSGNIASDKWVYTYTIEYLDFTIPSGNGSTIACLADTTLPVPPVVNDNCGNALTPTGPVTGKNNSLESTHSSLIKQKPYPPKEGDEDSW